MSYSFDDSQSEIEKKQDTITGAATTIASSNLIANRVLVSDANGKVSVGSTTAAQLLSGTINGTTTNDGTGNTSFSFDGQGSRFLMAMGPSGIGIYSVNGSRVRFIHTTTKSGSVYGEDKTTTAAAYTYAGNAASTGSTAVTHGIVTWGGTYPNDAIAVYKITAFTWPDKGWFFHWQRIKS